MLHAGQNLVTVAQLYKKSHLKKLARTKRPWRWLKVTAKGTFRLTTHHFLLVVWSNDIILHWFGDITTLNCTRLPVTLRSHQICSTYQYQPGNQMWNTSLHPFWR